MSPDYWITRVRFDSNGSHIVALETRKSNGPGKNIDKAVEMTRKEVIDLLDKGQTFKTAPPGENGKLTAGAPVKAYPMTMHFLKTKADNSTKDNLDNLPKM